MKMNFFPVVINWVKRQPTEQEKIFSIYESRTEPEYIKNSNIKRQQPNNTVNELGMTTHRKSASGQWVCKKNVLERWFHDQ